MKQYTIVPITGTPDWTAVPTLTLDESPWLDAAGVSAQAKLCYDEGGIHVRMAAREQHIRAAEPPMGMACQDSCLELFLCPQPGDDRYLNIEFGAGGCLFLGFGRGRADRIRLLVPEELTLSPVIERDAEGWSVTYYLPLTLMQVFFPGLTLCPGAQVRANCYKCGDLTDHPHYLLWNPSTSQQPDYHRSCDFGIMRFGKKGEH